MRQLTIQHLEEQGLIVFSAVVGSHAYGTALPTSDIDIRGVFIQPLEDILSFGYVEQVNDSTNDIIYYEIRRFLELLQQNNPNILELLNVPADCVRFKDPIFDLVLDQKDEFLSKVCKMSFGGYAIQQIRKARGYNKKMNWEEKEMTRKTVIDFCYVLEYGGIKLFSEWLQNHRPLLTQKNFGLAAIDHAHDLYGMYINPTTGEWGIVSDEDKANDVQLTSIPKGIPLEGYLTFNKDAYSTHCRRYKEYQTWLNERNEDRFKMNKAHGKQYDSKNLAHCIRVLDMAIDIAEKHQIIVRRPGDHIKLLMKIRKGEMEYDDILSMADKKIKKLDQTFEKTDLPDKVDKEFVNNLLLVIRKIRYYI